MHVPLADPTSGNVVAVITPGDAYVSGWSTASGLPEAPSDGTQYARRNAAWIAVSVPAATILASLLTVDGPGSGIDADYLDGIDSTGFATKTYVDAAIAVFDAGTY